MLPLSRALNPDRCFQANQKWVSWSAPGFKNNFHTWPNVLNSQSKSPEEKCKCENVLEFTRTKKNSFTYHATDFSFWVHDFSSNLFCDCSMSIISSSFQLLQCHNTFLVVSVQPSSCPALFRFSFLQLSSVHASVLIRCESCLLLTDKLAFTTPVSHTR